MFFKKIPKWVEELPDSDPNKEVLIQLSRASKKTLESPREMNFDIKDVKSFEDAQEMQALLEGQEWSCAIQSDQDGLGYVWVAAQKGKYSITKESLQKDEALFMELARKYDATYDGWYASLG